jgi:hypothetical protein
MQLQMTSCSRCLYCQGILYDEEIMSGWTAEDSNLNTKCPFCERMVVPFLTIRVVDFRTRPCIEKESKSSKVDARKDNDGTVKEPDQDVSHNGDLNATSEQLKEDNNSVDKEELTENKSDATLVDLDVKDGDSVSGGRPSSPSEPTLAVAEASEEEPQIDPVISDHITVPYLSPLVLRKELENMLETEGDRCLCDASVVDTHPIIYWNLLWFYERIAVKSHLPGLCLKAASLNRPSDRPGPDHPSWASADHRNIYIKCKWDNERLHDSKDPPLYTMWRQHHVRVVLYS